MMVIRSPLGALGALMVLMQAISVGALAAIRSQPILQMALVSVIIFVLLLVTILVCFLIIRFALRTPGLLFNPQDIAPGVHPGLYLPIEPGQVVQLKQIGGVSDPGGRPDGKKKTEG
jgi:hypothetical protein